jgi:hypothetical protein
MPTAAHRTLLSIGRDERELSDNSSPSTSPEEFLSKMDLGEFDGNLTEEIRKLTREQLRHVARTLLKRLNRRGKAPSV